MDLLAELLAEGMFPDDLIIEPCTGSDAYGNKTYGAAYTIEARIVGRIKIIVDSDGRESVSHVQATIAGAPGTKADDRFTLPVRFSANPSETDPTKALAARQPTALAVDHLSDEFGPHHEIIHFSNANARQRTY